MSSEKDNFTYAKMVYERVLNLLEEHHNFIRGSIPLIASENVPSPAVREALVSDFGNRYAEGWPGERIYAGCKYIDEVELLAIELGKKLYKAEFVDVRPISGVVANLITYTALTEPGDVMMSLAIPHGGHISHNKRSSGGTAGTVRGLIVEHYEFDEYNYEINLDATRKKLKSLASEGKKPKIFMLGASVFLFPHPVREIKEMAKEFDAYVVYDAAHVAGLIAGGIFQDPLREGADVMTMSTHKTLAGPQHGMLCSWSKYEEALKKAAFPGMLSNHHLHAVAGVAICLAEAIAFYKDYAKQIVRNSKALAQALYERGMDVLYEHRGFTESHMIVVDVSKYMNGKQAEEKLEQARIIVNRNLIPKDYRLKTDYRTPSGIRLGTQEVTRLGMRESEMDWIADLIAKVIVKGEDPSKVAQEVSELKRPFNKVHYCFTSKTEAYSYIQIR